MELEGGTDLAVLILFSAISLMIGIFCLGKINSSIKDYTMGDKTAIKAIGNNQPEEYSFTVRDGLLMYVIADEFQPQPKRIQIGSGSVITFDDAYLVSMTTWLTNLYNEQLSGIIDRDIAGFEYTYGDGKPRWRLILK